MPSFGKPEARAVVGVGLLARFWVEPAWRRQKSPAMARAAIFAGSPRGLLSLILASATGAGVLPVDFAPAHPTVPTAPQRQQ